MTSLGSWLVIIAVLALICAQTITAIGTHTQHTASKTQLEAGKDALAELMSLRLDEGEESSASPLASSSSAVSSALGSLSHSALASSASKSGSSSLALPDLNQILPPLPSGEASLTEVLPPYSTANADATVSPPLGSESGTTLALDLDRRIKQTQDLLDRMVFQLNRETTWATSVHDIIQNYQYKYSKVLQDIKAHSTSSNKMRDLLTSLKRARLHEILQNDLQKATQELNELATTSAETSEDEGSYASLKDRVALMKQDLEKMSNVKINKVLHRVQEGLKEAAAAAIPPESADTLKGLAAGGSASSSSASSSKSK